MWNNRTRLELVLFKTTWKILKPFWFTFNVKAGADFSAVNDPSPRFLQIIFVTKLFDRNIELHLSFLKKCRVLLHKGWIGKCSFEVILNLFENLAILHVSSAPSSQEWWKMNILNPPKFRKRLPFPDPSSFFRVWQPEPDFNAISFPNFVLEAWLFLRCYG